MKFLTKIILFISLFLGVFSISSAAQNTQTPANTQQSPSTGTTPSAGESTAGQGNSDETDSCTGNGDCLASPKYHFSTSKFVPGGTFKGGGTTKKRLENGLLTIIQRIMIPFGVISVIILTIGAGFMILSGGLDENITRGKKILKMGIVSISIALSSYLLVELLKYLLYT
ncbi:hypothetical protein HXK64_04120 [Candidatus Gracilibacteria bacterium]|nr:hypothetical protein [Candidatus Gracilibacteria bacterium]